VIGVVLGAGVIGLGDVVTLTDSCESTERLKASLKKIEIRILNHMEP
jgi:hypothetical protein